MPGECWKKVQYIRTGCFQNRQNAPSTGIFYLLWNNLHWQCSFQGTVDLEHCKTTMPFAFCPWTYWMRNCKFLQLMFCALTNIQVSNSLCLDGPSLGRNSFDFHLLVISHFVCSTTFILRLMDKIFAYLLTTLTFKVVTLSDHQTFIIIC